MQGKTNRSLGMVAALALTAALAGCERTTISDVSKHPVKYEGNEVTITGKVTQSGGDFARGAFEVDDGTGRLWVETDGISLPEKGSQIAVTGLVESGQSMGLNSMTTVLQEIRRYARGS